VRYRSSLTPTALSRVSVRGFSTFPGSPLSARSYPVQILHMTTSECTCLSQSICSCWMDSVGAFPMMFIVGALEKCLQQRAENDSVRLRLMVCHSNRLGHISL
jgi:hypothetical protein